VFCFSDSAEERSSEQCFVSVTVQKRHGKWVENGAYYVKR
jgi:hypothetical protein